MIFDFKLILIGISMFGSMILALEGGRRLGLARLARAGDSARLGTGVVESAVFGLLGLQIAFTFNSANDRFEARRQLIVTESNAIGTAYLRIDLVAEPTRTELQDDFRKYLDLRISLTRTDRPDSLIESQRLALSRLRTEIWKKAVAACEKETRTTAGMLFLPAVNEMFDTGDSQVAWAYMHVPGIILLLLCGLALLTGVLAGYAMAAHSRNWLHIIVFSLVIGVTIMMICDLEFPREGLIRIDRADQPMLNLKLGIGDTQSADRAIRNP